MWFITFIDFHMLDHLCIPGRNFKLKLQFFFIGRDMPETHSQICLMESVPQRKKGFMGLSVGD
jgi:hypothetical protein